MRRGILVGKTAGRILGWTLSAALVLSSAVYVPSVEVTAEEVGG